jgi:RNA polymerase sigma factor (sigma-70 family)
MEVSALKFSGGVGLHGRSPLLRVQSDDRLVALIRRGNEAAFEVLFARYHSRLLAFCRHMVGTREDGEDVLQEVMAAAYNALRADDRPVNLRPWLYRIARNRSLNHLRKATAVGVDSMDIHFSDFGASTADKASKREEFQLLVSDIQGLPETQRTALVLREMDALPYEQIAEAMDTTVPSIKSLLVRARVGLAEAAEARALSCDEVRDELGEVAEGLKRKLSPPVRRHLKTCTRCNAFRVQLKETNKALAALLPLGPLVLLKKFLLTQLGHHAGSGATAAGSSAGVAGGTAAGGGIMAGSGGLVSAGVGAIATKAAAGLAAAALITAGAVAVDHTHHHQHAATHVALVPSSAAAANHTASPVIQSVTRQPGAASTVAGAASRTTATTAGRTRAAHRHGHAKLGRTTTTTTPTTPAAMTPGTTPTATTTAPGRTATQTVPTVLPPTPPTSSITTTSPAPTVTAGAPPVTTPTATTPTATATAPTATTTTGTASTGTTSTGTTSTGTGMTTTGTSTTPGS